MAIVTRLLAPRVKFVIKRGNLRRKIKVNTDYDSSGFLFSCSVPNHMARVRTDYSLLVR